MKRKTTKVSNKFLAQLAQGSYWTINKDLHRILGLEETFLLQHFIDLQFNVFGGEEFYQQQERIMDILRFGEKKVRSIISKLSSLGILSIVKKDIPAKNYYFVNMDVLVDIMETSSDTQTVTSSGSPRDTTGDAEWDTTNKTIHSQDPSSQDPSFTKPLNIIPKEDIPKEDNSIFSNIGKIEDNEIDAMVDEVFECVSFVQNFCDEYDVELIHPIYDFVDEYFSSLSDEEKINYLWKNTK